MAKTFLRSGNLDAVLALGENGLPVYLSALQLRETLRLRKQQHIADCLAIPQPNDAGDRLDWYAPVSGKISSWAGATDSARSQALSQLVACQQAVADLCQRAQNSEKPGQKLFGALLAKALQFPDQNFVYLVGGKPVITFWGFVSLEKKTRLDALDCLRTEPEEIPTLSKRVDIPPPPVIATPPVPVPEPIIVLPPAPQEPAAEPAPVTPVAVAPARKNLTLLRYGWTLPAVALLIALGVQLKSCVSQPQTTQAVQPPVNVKPVEPPAPTPAPPVAKPVLAPELPLAPASSTQVNAPQPEPQAVPPTEAVSEEAAIPVAKDDLVMPTDAVKLGSTKFLNGNWRALPGGKNPVTGKPPGLRYQMKNGKGTLKLTQGDGVSCRVDVFAGLMKSGNLVINSRTKAKCSDGSRYQMPDLVCKQGISGPAECSGQYDANTVLPMTMKRESK
ncbi:SrfA family protein [Erwinia oleae]|uniref:SrfA family protein n=1 Tax=Erwinia oleae TaxID=796334 RepID=UPI00055676DA|nr:SrfA family protein [Erwinia oleae]